jgi:hypothetical protein
VFVITAMRTVAGFDPEDGAWPLGRFGPMDDGGFGGMWAEAGREVRYCWANRSRSIIRGSGSKARWRQVSGSKA